MVGPHNMLGRELARGVADARVVGRADQAVVPFAGVHHVAVHFASRDVDDPLDLRIVTGGFQHVARTDQYGVDRVAGVVDHLAHTENRRIMQQDLAARDFSCTASALRTSPCTLCTRLSLANRLYVTRAIEIDIKERDVVALGQTFSNMRPDEAVPPVINTFLPVIMQHS